MLLAVAIERYSKEKHDTNIDHSVQNKTALDQQTRRAMESSHGNVVVVVELTTDETPADTVT